MTPHTRTPGSLTLKTRSRNSQIGKPLPARAAVLSDAPGIGDSERPRVTVNTPPAVEISPPVTVPAGSLGTAPARSGFPLSPCAVPGLSTPQTPPAVRAALDRANRFAAVAESVKLAVLPSSVLSKLATVAAGDDLPRLRRLVTAADRVRAGICGRRADLRAQHRALTDAVMDRAALDDSGPVILRALAGDRGALAAVQLLADSDPLAAAVLSLFAALTVAPAVPSVELAPLSVLSPVPSAVPSCTARQRQHRKRPRPVSARCLIVSRPACAPPVLAPEFVPATHTDPRARAGP